MLDNVNATVTLTCPRCGTTHERLAILHHAVVCSPCVVQEAADAATAWRSASLGMVGERADAILRSAGMGTLERNADLALVPVTIKRALPRENVQHLLAGDSMTNPLAPSHGFGLTGGQGIGKSMCLAALLRAWVVQRLTAMIAAQESAVDGDDEVLLYRCAARVRWVHLPSFAETIKATSVQDKGTATIDAMCRSVSGAAVVVLDDVGRERIARGGYDEDLAVSALDRIIDARSRARLPIWWTANITPAQLASRYGAALTSRLLGLAPAIELPAMTDIRLAPPTGTSAALTAAYDKLQRPEGTTA